MHGIFRWATLTLATLSLLCLPVQGALSSKGIGATVSGFLTPAVPTPATAPINPAAFKDLKRSFLQLRDGGLKGLKGLKGLGRLGLPFTLVSAAVANEGSLMKVITAQATGVIQDSKAAAIEAHHTQSELELAKEEKRRAQVLQTAEVLKWYHGTMVATDYLRSQGYGARWC